MIPEKTEVPPKVHTFKHINGWLREGWVCEGMVVYRGGTFFTTWGHGMKSHVLIPIRPSQLSPPAITYSPTFPSSRLAIRFTWMMVVLAFTAGFWHGSPFGPEDTGDIFPQHFACFLRTTRCEFQKMVASAGASKPTLYLILFVFYKRQLGSS